MKRRVLFSLACAAMLASPAGADEPIPWKKWSQIRYGMPKAEVLRILGEPQPREGEPQYSSVLEYAEILPPSPQFPRGIRFSVTLNREGQVDGLFNPYEQDYSGAKGPAKLMLLAPADKMEITHQPAIVDFRWNPWPGGDVRPTYQIEIASRTSKKTETYTTEIPWFATTLDTPGIVRWRVKALAGRRNSSWSEWRQLDVR